MIAWSGVRVNLVLGLTPMTSEHVVTSVQSDTRRVTRSNLLTMLPSALHSLTSVEPWKQITTRVSGSHGDLNYFGDNDGTLSKIMLNKI